MALRPVFGADGGLTLAARTSIPISRNPAWAAGDVILVTAMLRDTTVAPTMVGAQLIGQEINTTASHGHQLVAFWIRDDGGITNSWTITWGGSSITCDAVWRPWRGCPPTGSPIDGYAAGSTTVTGRYIPYAPTEVHGNCTVINVVCSYQTTYPTQAQQWFTGPDNGDAYVSQFEYPFGTAGVTPTPAPLGPHSLDAWTSMTFGLRDGGQRDAAYDVPFGLAGVSSPANGGWPGGYADTVALGANHVRVDFGPGMSTAASDAEFADAAAYGLSVMPIIVQYQQVSTIDATAYSNYVASFVARYGPGGTFWAGRTDGDLAPQYIEILNEPWGTWFVGTVEPSAYASLYIQAVTAGRAANPACKYLIAGVDRYYQSSTWNPWFSAMFSAQPTLGAYIDGYTIHEYGITPLNLSNWLNYQQWPQIESVAAYLASQGVNVRAWVTEFGFDTASNTGSPDYGVSEQQQAGQILQAMQFFHGRWSDLVGATVYFNYRDGVADGRQTRFGLVHYDGTRKPAFDALRAILPLYVSGLAPLLSSAFGQRLFDFLEPWQTDHLAWYCNALGVMFDPVLTLADQQGSDGDSDFVPGWGSLFDVDSCPPAQLPYLGQFVGVQVPIGTSEPVARALIRAESGLNRGTLASVQSAIERNISTPWQPVTSYTAGTLVTHDPGDGGGPRTYLVATTFTSGSLFDSANLTQTDPNLWYRVYERQRGDGTSDAYALAVVVRPEQLTPTNDTTAVTAAINATKPAGIILYVTATDSPAWSSATKTWGTVGGTVTWGNVATGNV